MECEKCKSNNVKVEKSEKSLVIDRTTHEECEVVDIYIKCLDCGYEFIECV